MHPLVAIVPRWCVQLIGFVPEDKLERKVPLARLYLIVAEPPN